MSSYLRPKHGGASIFFTVGLSRRGGSLLVDEVDRLRAAVQETMVVRTFVIDAWVVLPDHLHAVWTLPDGDTDLYRSDAAPVSRLCGLCFEGQRAFPAQS